MAIFMQRNTFISYCPTRMLGGPGAYASSPRKNVVQFGAFFLYTCRYTFAMGYL